MLMTYGSSIGKKFYEDGQVRPFRGNTVVADITTRNPAYTVMLKLREMVKAYDLDEHYILLPPDSYHMTVIDGLVSEVRDEAHWPAALAQDASMETADAYISAAIARAALPGPVCMRFDAIHISKNCIIVHLFPNDETQEQILRTFRDRAAAQIGLKLPKHDTYRFHISLGYTRIVPEGDAAERLAQMVDAMNTFLAEQSAFMTGVPYMAYFEDMHKFTPAVDPAMAERGFISPNDDGVMADTDSQSIQNAVDLALKIGLGRVVIPRYNKRTGNCQWDVDKAIILDSDLEIVLDNCYIRQADGSMDNVFRNFPADGQQRRTLAEEQHNIIIRGVGHAVIDGGVGNGLTQKTSCKDGRPHIFMNNVILLHNLRDFKLENFTVANQRHWGINLLFCEKGVISGLNLICRNDLRNQDGMDLRFGCNNILIKDMTGQAGDDFIALTAIQGERAINYYAVEGKCFDIHDIVIQNVVATSAECTLVALRSQDGVKIHDITIDNVHDVMTTQEAQGSSTNVLHLDMNRYLLPQSPYALVRIGHDDLAYVHKRICGPGDVYGIHVSNLHARCNSALMLNGDIEDSYFGNIYAGNDVDRIVLTTSCRLKHMAGVSMRNVVFENIFYDCRENPHSIAFDLIQTEKPHTFENVQIRRAFLGNCAKAVNMQHGGTLTLDGVYGEDLQNKITVAPGGTVVIDGETIQ